MTLRLGASFLMADALRRYSRHVGGFAQLAARLAAALERDQENYCAVVTDWPTIAMFRRQRDTTSSGGFQSLLKKLRATLTTDDGRELRDWNDVRAAILAEERRREGSQPAFADWSGTCG